MVSKRINLGLVPQLPDEILQEIFVRLPLETLVKQTVVCKLWNSLIKTSAFILVHRDRNQHQNLLLTKVFTTVKVGGKDVCRHRFYLRRDEPRFSVYAIYYHPFRSYNRLCATSVEDRLKITRTDEIQTCNGLVCLASGLLDRSNYTALLWNPCIRKFVTLPALIDKSLEVYTISYGFGYDLRTDDYKVVRIVKYRPETERKTSSEIWSLKRPSWRGLSVLPPVNDFDPDWSCTIFVCNAVHWVHHPCKRYCYHDGPIISFDMSNEVFGEIMMPQVMRNNNRNMYISKYRNSLAILQWDHPEQPGVDMWVMKEYGVVESWTKLLTVKLPFLFEWLGFRNSGDTVIKYSRRLRWEQKLLNPDSDGVLRDFQVDGGENLEHLFVEPFVETLVLLDHPSAISTSLKLKKKL